MLNVSTWNQNGLVMSLLELSTGKPFMVFYYQTIKGFISRIVWENRLRFKFETFTSFTEFSEAATKRNSTKRVLSIHEKYLQVSIS